MPLAVFVILHYMTFDVTVQCINSILNCLSYQNYKIIVVDNGSPNDSGEKIKEMYAKEEKVHVINLKANLGFSAGNNVGYAYAKACLGADYIFVINNDTEIIQNDMVDRAIECYKSTDCYVMGPDIINLEQEHQNPRRNHSLTKSNVRLLILKETISNRYWRTMRWLKCSPTKVYFILKQRCSGSSNRIRTIDKMIKNVVLQGACIIFSPLYVKENDIAFEELTFMYCEEDLLEIKCKKNNWLMVYDPSIKILHAEQVATKFTHPNIVDKKIFVSENIQKALKVVLIELSK